MTPGDVTAKPDAYQAFNARRFWLSAYKACDARSWSILEGRYIHDKTYPQLADELGLSERHVRRLGSDAMDAALRQMQIDYPETRPK